MQAERNAPCPCGSGKKYKKCCLTKDVTQHFPKPVDEFYRDFQFLGNQVQETLFETYTRLERAELETSIQEFLHNPLIEKHLLEAFRRTEAYQKHMPPLFQLMLMNGLRMPDGLLLHDHGAKFMSASFTKDQRETLERLRTAQMGLFQIEDLFPETHRVRVRDLLRDRVILIHDVKLSQSGPRYLILLGKVVHLPEIEAHILYTLSPYAIEPEKKQECILQMQRCAEHIEPGCTQSMAWHQVLNTNPIAFYWLDIWVFHQSTQPMDLSIIHKSGQKWVHVEMEYHCDDFNAALKGLRRKRVLTEEISGEMPEEPHELSVAYFVWLDDQDSLLASLTLNRDAKKLNVTCQTRRHAGELRRKLATLSCLEETSYNEQPIAGRNLKDLDRATLDSEFHDEADSGPDIPMEMIEQLQKRFIDDLYDQRIPVLKNMTPAQAVKQPAMRPLVIEWLESMEHHYSVGNPIMQRLNTDSLRNRLGL